MPQSGQRILSSRLPLGIAAISLCFFIIGCQPAIDPYPVLISGGESEVRGWIHSHNRVGNLPMLRDLNGREYGIENLPTELENQSVQIKAKAKYSRKIDIPGFSNRLVISMSGVEPATPEIKRWDEFINAEYSSTSGFIAAFNSVRDDIGVPIPYWPTPGTEPTRDVAGFSRSGCGLLHMVFVKTILQYVNRRSLISDDVFELDENGTVVRQWHIPGNDIVIGAMGHRLLVGSPLISLFQSDRRENNHSSNLHFAVGHPGHMEIIQINTQLLDVVPMTCPTIKEFGDSAYTRCAIVTDIASGLPRRLAYQGPCT